MAVIFRLIPIVEPFFPNWKRARGEPKFFSSEDKAMRYYNEWRQLRKERMVSTNFDLDEIEVDPKYERED